MTRSKHLSLLIVPALLALACGLLPTPFPTSQPAPSDTAGPPVVAATATASNTPLPTPTDTPLPTHTPTKTLVPMMNITVFFQDHDAFVVGTPPYEVGVTRSVPQTVAIARAVLIEYFNGPTPAETAAGLMLITSGATGFSDITIHDTIARVYLTGSCNSQGATYTIANLLYANLMQFATVSYVKVYDQNGNTQEPAGYSNSIPACLEP